MGKESVRAKTARLLGYTIVAKEYEYKRIDPIKGVVNMKWYEVRSPDGSLVPHSSGVESLDDDIIGIDLFARYGIEKRYEL